MLRARLAFMVELRFEVEVRLYRIRLGAGLRLWLGYMLDPPIYLY